MNYLACLLFICNIFLFSVWWAWFGRLISIGTRIFLFSFFHSNFQWNSKLLSSELILFLCIYNLQQTKFVSAPNLLTIWPKLGTKQGWWWNTLFKFLCCSYIRSMHELFLMLSCVYNISVYIQKRSMKKQNVQLHWCKNPTQGCENSCNPTNRNHRKTSTHSSIQLCFETQ